MKEDLRLKLQHYKFTKDDALILKELQNTAEENLEDFVKGFYEFIFEFKHAKIFISNNDILKKHENAIKNWFLNLFCGVYDKNYFKNLHKVSKTHIKIHLPANYVNASFGYVRGFVRDMLIKHKKYEEIASFDKILDINLDILIITSKIKEQENVLNEVIFLRKCIEEKNIEPYFQPMYCVKNPTYIKYEALMRLIDIDNEKVFSVFPYLSIAKKIKLYKQMTRIMVEKVFAKFQNHDIEFSVNLCYEDIEDIRFTDYMIQKVKNFPYPKNIIFEIVETDFVKDFSIVESFTSSVRQLGCKIAIDDFGSGFSSMENILKLKPDFIKIDGSLIKNLDTSNKSKIIVKSIVNMARDLGVETVAEYVHSKEIKDIVIDLGVDYLQGFYLGEPKPYLLS